MEKKRKISKATVVIVITILLLALGIGFLVYSFVEMHRYQKYRMVVSYDMESPEVNNRVEVDGKSVCVTAQNLKGVEYYLCNEAHKPYIFGVKKGECIKMKFIRGNGAISNVKVYQTNKDYVYLEYESEQGNWNYYISGKDTFANIKKAVSPEGRTEPNTVLKH